jgi:hypothetical protein
MFIGVSRQPLNENTSEHGISSYFNLLTHYLTSPSLYGPVKAPKYEIIAALTNTSPISSFIETSSFSI